MITLTNGQTLTLGDAHLQDSHLVGKTSDVETEEIPLSGIH